jgi:hypothetical protein
MNKQLASAVAIVAALLSGAAVPAAAQAPSGHPAGETYNWLHPKLGFVKVDRATGATVRSRSSTDPSGQAGGREVNQAPAQSQGQRSIHQDARG